MSDQNYAQHISITETPTGHSIYPIITEFLAEEKSKTSTTSTNDYNVKVKPLIQQSQVKATSERIECKKMLDLVRKHHIESKGMEIALFANYFCLLTKPTLEIYRYDVIIKPKIAMRQERIRLLDELKANLPAFIYDGKQLFTTTNLETISLKSERHSVILKQIELLELNHKQTFQSLNLILRRSMKQLNLQHFQHNYFDPKCKIDLIKSMEMLSGHNTMSGRLDRKEILCVQVKNKIVPKETLYDILQKCIRNSKDYQNEFCRKVIGMVVYSTYNYRTHRIDGVDFNRTPKDTFNKQNIKISFLKYYYTNYNLRIRDCNQPLLLSIKKTTINYEDQFHVIKLIPELCCPTGLSDEIVTNVSIMRAISGYTRLDPKGYVERLKKFNTRLKDSENSVRILKDWNMTSNKKLVQFKALNIDPPPIILQHCNNSSTGDVANWSSVFKNFGMYWTPSRGLHRWSLIFKSEDACKANKFVEVLRNIGRKFHMPIALPRRILISNYHINSYFKAMEECFCYDPQLVMCIVRNNSHDRIASIKKKSYVDRGVPCQIITLTESVQQHMFNCIATKSVLVMNSKLSYAPWMIDIPLNDLMTVGFHFYDSDTIPARKYCTLVATMNLKKNPTFFSTAIECSSKPQHADQVMHMLSKALDQYAAEHGKLPYHILFYHYESRNMELLYDIKNIVAKLHSQYVRYKAKQPPKFAYITVSEYVSLRLFNSTVGTVVDDIITTPKRFVFFLVPQTIQTCAMYPIFYNVLFSTLNLTVNQLQILTCKMCHLNYESARAVQIPAVCQYARKLSYLINNTFNNVVAIALQKKLHYL